jgi:cbb3-type cytochrome oxidase subunit 3
MKLADVMSAMHLASYAEVALVLFLAAFAAILWHVFHSRNRDLWESARRLPLDPESTPLSLGTDRPSGEEPSRHDQNQ